MAYTTINKPIEHFSTNLWVADDTSPRSFTGFGHQPDFVWIKNRDQSEKHILHDTVRGVILFTQPQLMVQTLGQHILIDINHLI